MVKTNINLSQYFVYVFGGMFLTSAKIFLKEITTIFKELLINEQITANEVRLIGLNGEQLGIVSLSDAQRRADEEGYDLVLMSASANPPVCKILDYSKYKFDAIKKEKELKKNQKVIELKEIQLSMTISEHDISYRVTSAIKFLQEGNKVKVVLRMKGRQQAYLKNCIAVVKDFVSRLADFGVTDKEPEVTGRNIMVVVSPKK